jgi:hypothetical protein
MNNVGERGKKEINTFTVEVGEEEGYESVLRI